MNIVLLEDASEMGGVQHSTLNFILGMKAFTEHAVHLLLPGEGGFSRTCDTQDLPYHVYPHIELHKSSKSYWNDRVRLPNIVGLLKNRRLVDRQVEVLIELIRDMNPSVLLTKGMGAHFSGGRVGKRLNLPVVWHLQDFISERYAGLYRTYFAQQASVYASYCIADGSSIKNQLSPSMQEKCEVIFNGVPLEQFYQPESRSSARKRFHLPEEAYVIGNIARVTPWKGQDVLVEAFIEYAPTNENAHLVIVGSPLFGKESYLEYLKQKVKDAGLESRCHFLGYQTELGVILSLFDVFIYPPVEKDTSPLSLISGMAAGLPIGISDIEGLVEMTEGCEGVRVCENKNSTDIVETMNYFESPELRKKAGTHSRQWASRQFSQKVYTEKIMGVLEKVT